MAEDQRYTSLDANARARSNVIKGPRICTDGVWAAIFLAHLALVVVLAAMHMPELFHAARTDFVEVESKHNATIDPELQAAAGDAARRAWPFVVVGLGVSFLWSIVWIIIVQVFSESLIWFALVFTPFLFLVLTLWPGNPSPIVSGLLFLLTTFYACWIIFTQRFRVEFAKLTLQTIAGVIRRYPGTWIMSLLSVVPATLWQLFWLLTAGSTLYHFYQRSERFAYQDKAGMTREGVRMEPLAYLALIFLALSTYWTTQVIGNVVHVTNSGVVATWYFRQDRMPARPTLGALGRSLTSSFGSICLGSLLVALVQLLHDLAESARQNSQEGGLISSVVWCCVVCCIGYLELLVELFNHWAFVQVAIYGKDFKTAAKHTWQLVETRGLSGLVNMNLTSNAVALGTTIGAVLTAALVAGLAYHPVIQVPTSEPGMKDGVRKVYESTYALTIVAAALCALVCTSVVSSAITSGITTLFVCWAEDPAALQAVNPALHASFDEISSKFLREHPPRHGFGPNLHDPENPAPSYAPRSTQAAPPTYQAPAVVGRDVPVAYAVPAPVQGGPRGPPGTALL